MKTRRLALLVLLLSALLAAGGAWLVCRSFADTLDNAVRQAAAQHLREVCALDQAFLDTQGDENFSYHFYYDGAGIYHTRTQDYLIADRYAVRRAGLLGNSQCRFALLRGGENVVYSNLPDTVGEDELFAAAAAGESGMLLAGPYLLLADETPSTRLTVVTATDLSGVFAARGAQLRRWMALQGLLLAFGLFAVWQFSRLQELNDRQRRFVAALTHELKTPMTAIIGYADLLRSGEVSEERRRLAADTLYHETARLESLSQRLLSLQRLQNAPPLSPEPVPVAAVFADVARSLPGLPVRLAADAPPEAAVLADRVLLADLLQNLVLNAAHASAPQSTVRLGCARSGGGWRLTVTDEGKGIPPEALPHIKEPFYRVDKARARADGGSGLGLALCDEIARAFGGTLTLASEPGRGTTATVELKGVLPHEDPA